MVYGLAGAVQAFDKLIITNPREIACKSAVQEMAQIYGVAAGLAAKGLTARDIHLLG